MAKGLEEGGGGAILLCLSNLFFWILCQVFGGCEFDDSVKGDLWANNVKDRWVELIGVCDSQSINSLVLKVVVAA